MTVFIVYTLIRAETGFDIAFTSAHNTVEHGQLITKKYLGEHKVITAEQQFLGLILWFFMHLK